jgi:hypothetical protein
MHSKVLPASKRANAERAVTRGGLNGAAPYLVLEPGGRHSGGVFGGWVNTKSRRRVVGAPDLGFRVRGDNACLEALREGNS